MKRNYNLFIAFLFLAAISGCSSAGNKTAENINKSVNNSNVAIVVNSSNITNTSNSVTTTNSLPLANSATRNANTLATTMGPQTGSKLSVANFDKLEKGMTYADVVKILGSEGKIISDGTFQNVRTVMYEWKGDAGSFLKVVFQNDKLYDKAHTGLK